MAYLHANDQFNPDELGAGMVGIASLLGNHDSGLHQHQMGQLLFAKKGCIRISLDGLLCLLPSSRAAWIPPGIKHRAEMRQVVDYRSLYFDLGQFPALPSKVQVIEVNPLLRAVLERLAMADFDTDWQQARHANLLSLCIEEINQAKQEPLLLVFPLDQRVSCLQENLEQLPLALHLFAQQIAASEKTISRIFQRETGMSYQEWRQQWRLLRAVEMLAENGKLSETASALGFASDSAFIAFFKSRTGKTPRAYFS
ncbi:helix-turn-helix transcriptional regulator [Iodobacter sp. CM08]|uniref:AraC family transcriptional regulator n=1 Tax=Iodobacter sp. CM08 TaxID=3085902 RepID=UPI0029823A8C|nr:helix-turn-helix transcriptional regulator [Iodobacter sp. CM08]MDW5417423.1 helix-turn-helix transcriptional regulator [Iodobacter sp. CM08]